MYVVVSRRVGTPGAPFVPRPGINVAALLDAGHIVEVAPTRALFERPRHPYTAALIRSVPASAGSLADLQPIPGSLPDLRAADIPACRFADRCSRAQPVCRSAPLPVITDATSTVACHFPL